MEKVAAIILNYNSSKDCEKCLSYISKQDYEDISVVIVDNASPDPNEKNRLVTLQERYQFELIFSSKNQGFSAGNNIGLKWANEIGASWALIINPDVELRDPNYISHVMHEKEKWEKVAVIGTDVRLPSGERQNPQRESSYWESVLWPIETLKSKIDKKRNRYLCENTTGYCEKVTGACFFIELSAAREMGYLDENVFMYSEEAILSAKVKGLGKKLLYVSGVTANHEHYAAKKANSAGRMIKFLKSREYYYTNYSDYESWQIKLIQVSMFFERMYWRLRKTK